MHVTHLVLKVGISLSILAVFIASNCHASESEAQDDKTKSQGSLQDSLKFDPQTLIKDPFPAITTEDLQVLDFDEADSQIDDRELVIGIEKDGQAMAYPVNILTGPRREILNTELGETPVAVTW